MKKSFGENRKSLVSTFNIAKIRMEKFLSRWVDDVHVKKEVIKNGFFIVGIVAILKIIINILVYFFQN